MATSFLSWLSCLVGNLILSITLMATSLPLFLCFPKTWKEAHNMGFNTLVNQTWHDRWLTVKPTSIHNAKLAWSQHLIREYLIHWGNILQRYGLNSYLWLLLACGKSHLSLLKLDSSAIPSSTVWQNSFFSQMFSGKDKYCQIFNFHSVQKWN